MTAEHDSRDQVVDDDETTGTDDWRGQTSLAEGHQGTFPAFEEHKAEAGDPEFLLEITPEPFDQFLERFLDTEYVEQRKQILEQRDETETEFTRRVDRIESIYGEVINRVLDRRLDGDSVLFDVENYWQQVSDVQSELDSLRGAVDEAYLTYAEQKYLSNIEGDIVSAREYLRNKRAFDDHQADLGTDIEEFDTLFEPYSGGNRYMISSDQEELIELAHSIHHDLQQTARELQIQILPDDDIDWLEEQKARFQKLTEELPDYNTAFVKRQRDQYEHVFETSHGLLKPAQQKAIIRNDRRNLVDASAGTGKTLTLTHRFVYLLERGVSPADIVAVTFTSDAAEEMKGRIADRVDDVREGSLQISTIHSFANGITRQYHSQQWSTEPGEMQEQLAEEYYKAAINNERPDTEPNPDAFEAFATHIKKYISVEAERNDDEPRAGAIIEDLTDFIEKAQTFDLSPEEIRQRTPDSNKRVAVFGLAGAALVEAYRSVAEDINGPIDYDAMLTDAIEVIKKHPKELGNRYDHILVDEFQDVSETEVTLFNLLVENGSESHLFCVGDDWQSIYGFRGSDVRIFTGFPDDYPDTTYTSLDVNFRCPPAIVQAGATLMENATVPQNSKAVTAHSDIEMSPIAHKLRLFEQRGVEYVANLIEDSLNIDSGRRLSAEHLHSDDHRDYGDVMVISQNDKNSNYLRQLRSELKSRGLPFRNPKYIKDHIPDWYEDLLDREITYDSQQFVEYADKDERPDEPEAPPVIQLKSIYSAKGTEAPVVILAPATDGPTDGIPPEDRPNGLFEPVVANPAEHLPEQRRLFYVALTRAEEEFHAVGADGQFSRFIHELDDFFEEKTPPLEGRCSEIEEPHTERAPYKVFLDSGDCTIELVGWDAPTDFTVDEPYRISDPEIERDKYGTDIRYDKSRIVPLDSE